MVKGLGSFCLIKNEGLFIKAHLDSWLPILESMVFYDGGSTDGTLEIIKEAKKRSEFGNKIKLYEDKDPKDLTQDYQKLSNDAMWSVDSDYAIFLHPDQFFDNASVAQLPKGTISATCNMRSFAGEPDGQIYEIKGRGEKWKNIYRLRNPNLGAHYYGSYGASNEDTYFSEITGNAHEHYSQSFHLYPYPVHDSGITILHYSDVRPYKRRLERMIKCMINQGYSEKDAIKAAPLHPRVSLKDGMGFKFNNVETPIFMGEKLEC